MSILDSFDRDRQRAREARRQARELRDLHAISKCGIDLRLNYGTKHVPQHIAMRIADQFPIWADEYDAIADQIEHDLEAKITFAAVSP